MALTAADHDSIAFLLRTFCSRGPAIHYESGQLTGPSYGELMGAGDLLRRPRSYLASEEAFAYVKDLQTRNLIVPLIGDFARRHEATVRVFYGSNVEVYLSREQTARFCGTLAVLPHDSESWFIWNKGMRTFQSKLDACR